MIRVRDPGLLRPEERLREIADLLAIGYRRVALRNSENRLAEPPESKAACVPVKQRTQTQDDIA